MDVLGWLKNLGLERYETIFRDNDIDTSVLSSLTNEDLKDIGVASLGHRRRLLEAIAILQDEEAGTAAGGRTVVAASKAERRQVSSTAQRSSANADQGIGLPTRRPHISSLGNSPSA